MVSTLFNRYQILYCRLLCLCATHARCGTLGSLYDLCIYCFSAHSTGFLKGKQHNEVEHRALGPLGPRPVIT